MIHKKLLLSLVASSLVATISSADSVWIDNSTNTHPQDSIKIGKDGSVGADGAIAVGQNADAQGDDSLSLGRYTTSAERGTSVGSYATSNDSATAVGINAKANGVNSVALGSDSTASADGAVAIGNCTAANGKNSVAIGKKAVAKADNSVALGFKSVANELNTVSVGNSTTKRRVTNVADGINSYDAVNVRQLNGVRDEARAGISSALSMAPLTPPCPGQTAVSFGVGSYKGEGATSINLNHRTKTVNGTDITYGVGVSVDTQDNVAGRANIGFIF